MSILKKISRNNDQTKPYNFLTIIPYKLSPAQHLTFNNKYLNDYISEFTYFKPKNKQELKSVIDTWYKADTQQEYDLKQQVIPYKYRDIGNWNVSLITDMSSLFWLNIYFNEDISSWDVSRVTNMECMFRNCENFNQPLNSWNVSRVKYMRSMFWYAKSFNQTLKDWDISCVKDMSFMFAGTMKFKKFLNWNISVSTDTTCMFWKNQNHPTNTPSIFWRNQNLLTNISSQIAKNQNKNKIVF